jgi:hypothetical protein
MARNFKKITTSMRGRVIDMDAMRAANEQSVAVGNAKMNARGDIMGLGGQIEIRREQIAREYHAANPVTAASVSLKPISADVFETPSEAMKRLAKAAEEATTGVNANGAVDQPEGLVQKKPRKLVDKADDE